jgi:hypothetical protein
MTPPNSALQLKIVMQIPIHSSQPTRTVCHSHMDLEICVFILKT